MASCDAGDEVACDELSREDEAKRAWLAKLDVPTWGAAAAAVSAVATELTQPQSEEEAKKAWLATLDAPTWGKAAAALASTAADAAELAGMTAACDAGDEAACDSLTGEEEAKRAWLGKLDVPTWGAAAAAVSSVASEVSAGSTQSAEEIAKQAWLAKQTPLSR